MILLDENIPEDQRVALLRWKPLQVGHDHWDKSVDDNHIAIWLRAERNPTFFTLDRHFFARRRDFGHPKCSIAFVDSPDDRFAAIVDRFLRHPSFRTHASRMGSVFKLNEGFITRWSVSDRRQTEISW